MIDDILDAMVLRLKEKLPAFTAEHFPDKPDASTLAKKREGFLVNFDGSTFGEPASTAPMSANEELKFAVTVRVLSLRGAKGAANMLREVRKAFFGWRPTKEGQLLGATKFLPVDTGFVDETEGVWRWAITFKTTVPAVEDLQPETGPALTLVTFKPAI